MLLLRVFVFVRLGFDLSLYGSSFYIICFFFRNENRKSSRRNFDSVLRLSQLIKFIMGHLRVFIINFSEE